MAEENNEMKKPVTAENAEEEKKIVVPGELLMEAMDYLPGKYCFREGNKIYAKRIGILKVSGRIVEVIPISGPYMPQPGDMVIGVVDEVQNAGWVVDINAPYMAFIPLSGVSEFIDTNRTSLSEIYAAGDLIYGKIMTVTPSKSVYISMQDPKAKKFTDGRVMKINNTKVPRLIGKQGSMITMIKNATKCWISVGQNGMIWLKGEHEDVAVEAIKMVEEYAHTSGLTDRIDAFLKERLPREEEKKE